MQNILQTYQNKQATSNDSFSPFELKDTYTSTSMKSMVNKQKLNMDNKTNGVLFLAETLKEEVLHGTQKQQKKNLKQLKKILIKFVTIAAITGVGMSFGILTTEPLTASASSLIATAGAETATEITPDTIMDWALKIALLVVAVGVGLSMSMFAVVGIYLMITRKRKEAMDWNSDIIKGVIQTLVAIPLIYALFQLSQIVFKNLPFLDGLM